MKISPIAVTAAFALAFGIATAQSPMKSGAMQKSPMKKTMPMKSGMKSVSGIVKGSMMGKKFMLGTKMGTYTVDASKASCTMKGGKSCPLSNLKGGTMVTVMGKASGKMMLMADKVTVTHMAGMKKSMGKPMTKPPMSKSGSMSKKG